MSAPRRPRGSRGRAQGPLDDLFERSLVRRALVWLAAAEVVALALVFDFSRRALHPIDLPKSLIATGAAVVTVALVALLVMQFGWRVIPRSPILAALAGYVTVSGVATLFAEDRYIALFGYQSRYLGFISILDLAILCVGVAVACRYVADRYLLGAAVVIVAAVALGYGLIQVLGLDPLPWTLYDPRVRPFSIFGNSDVFGHFLSVLIACSVAVTLWPPVPSLPIRAAAAGLALAGLAMGSVVATRGMALGVGSALIVGLIAYVWTGRMRRAVPLRPLAAVIAVVALGAALMASTPLGVRVRDTFTGAAVTADRRVLISVAVDVFAERPLLGWGPDNFAVAFPRYRSVESVVVLGRGHVADTPHNWLLDAAATTGILGSVGLTGLIVVGGLALVRQMSRTPAIAAPLLLGVAAYWSHGLVSVGSLAVDWFPWVALGFAASSETSTEGIRPVRRTGWPAPAIVLSIAIAMALLGMRQLEIDQDASAVSTLISRGRPDVAVFAAKTVVDRDPGRAEHWQIYGKALFAAKRWKQAGDAFQAAADRAPYVSAYWQNVALSRLREGDRAAALRAAEVGVAADRNEPGPHLAFAEIAATAGMSEVALTEALLGLRLRGDADVAAKLIAESARTSEPTRARAVVEDALRIRETVSLRLALASIALRAGDLPTAEANARRVLELVPTNQEAMDILTAARR